MTFVPLIIIVTPNKKDNSFYLITFSRYVRTILSSMILAKYYKLGQTDVDR